MQVVFDREVSRWLQCLDLTYSARDAQRCFSNGYLVAEILHRYYDKDFHLHSFSNGSSLDAKRDNWAQLLRILQKRNVMEVSRVEVERLICGDPSATCSFISALYELLTGRRLQAGSPAHPPATKDSAQQVSASGALKRHSGSMPPFARPTASVIASATARTPEVMAISDDGLRSAAVAAAVTQYEQALVMDRLQHPQRYAVGARATRTSARRAAVSLAASHMVERGAGNQAEADGLNTMTTRRSAVPPQARGGDHMRGGASGWR